MRSGSGRYDEYAKGKNRHKLYAITWESSYSTGTDENHLYLQLTNVRGTLYRSDGPGTTFVADTAAADKAAGLLTLAGNVHLNTVRKAGSSATQGSTLSCSKVTYAREDEIVRAQGDVMIKGDGFTVGPFDQVWSANDLSEFATPRMFRNVRHNGRLLSNRR